MPGELPNDGAQVAPHNGTCGRDLSIGCVDADWAFIHEGEKKARRWWMDTNAGIERSMRTLADQNTQDRSRIGS